MGLGQVGVGIDHPQAVKCKSQFLSPIRAAEVPYVAKGRDGMPVEKVNGLGIAYDVIGQGEPWVITPGGRFSKDAPGVRSWPRRWPRPASRY